MSTQFSDRDLWFMHDAGDVIFDDVNDAVIEFEEQLERLGKAVERLTEVTAAAEERGYRGDACYDAASDVMTSIVEELLSSRALARLLRSELAPLERRGC